MYALLLLQEKASGLIAAPGEVGVEETVASIVLWLKLFVESLGAFIIGVGIIAAVYVFLRSLTRRQTQSYNRIRLTFARYLALALEFQLAADILGTAVAPSWDQIGKLAVVAVIRTFLNYILAREMKEEREDIAGDTLRRGQDTARTPASVHNDAEIDTRRTPTAPADGDSFMRQ